MENCIGEYGVCIDDIGEGKYRYLVAGKYAGGEVPEGMVVYEFPRGDWAVFFLTRQPYAGIICLAIPVVKGLLIGKGKSLL